MADSGRSAGRARGRARSVNPANQNQPGGGGGGAPRPSRGPPTGQGGAWGPRPGGGGPVPQPQAPPQAWGPRRGGPTPQQAQQQRAPSQPQAPPQAWGPRPTGPTPQQAHHQRAPAPTTAPGQAGRATKRQGDVAGVVEDPGNLVVGSGGDAGNSAGRGSVRGRRVINYETHLLVTRPDQVASKKGLSGRPIRVTANYFEMLGANDYSLYNYRVDFAPDIDVTSVKKRLLWQGCREILHGYLFDGSSLFTPVRIQPDPMEVFVEDANGQPVRINIRLVGDVGRADYQILQCFNIIIRKCLQNMDLQQVGRNYYDAKASIQIAQYGIELWPGYETSMRQHEQNVLLCCEIAHKFMRKENVLKVLKECAQRDDNYKNAFNKLIIGCVVLTDYNNRTYRIDDVDWNVSPRSTFPKRDGSTISYIEYYKERYQLRINEAVQPMLVSRAKQRELRAGMAEIIYLVPELCRMTGLTERERGDFHMMRNLDTHTRLGPEGRQARLLKFSQRMNSVPKIVEELKKWEMKLSPNLIEFPARVLQPETIYQGTRGEIKYPAGEDTDWTRNLRSNPMINIGKVETWVVICPSELKRDAFGFVQALQKAAAGMSLRLPQPRLKEIRDDRPSTYLEGLDSAMSFNPNFILCVATNNKSDRYSAIKKKCCVDKAVPTQVILKRNISSKGLMSIATKVAIQINCKLGGSPWTVEIPIPGLMVVGFDVCHDTMDKGKSFGAMVSSLDKQCCHYFSDVTAHTSGEELSNDFSLNMIKAVKSYQDVNGSLPDKIIIYRDGVGDGQLPYVFKHEVKRIEEQLKAFYKEKEFKMAFIVVTKRINTRLFCGTKNPPPGTVVDDVITLPTRYDFFIVSQCVRQGTVSPTSYNVIFDTLNIGPEKMQRLTYKFTHLYYNWSGTVRVPAPCQYAHKLAFLVSQSLHRNPNPQLNRSLYFL